MVKDSLYVPTPECYVLYNGIDPFPEKKIYKFSDSFEVPDGNLQ